MKEGIVFDRWPQALLLTHEEDITLDTWPHVFDASPGTLGKIKKLGARRASDNFYFAVSRGTWRQTHSAANGVSGNVFFLCQQGISDLFEQNPLAYRTSELLA